MRARFSLLVVMSTVAIAGAMAATFPPQQPFTEDFGIEHLKFKPYGANPYFSLKPGTLLRYEGEDDGELIELEIKVLNMTKAISFEIDGVVKNVTARVIREREWADGELVEVSLNYFARSRNSGDIYYFGEDVNIFHDDGSITHDGAWKAGHNGALPGLIMPSVFLLGARYYQEIAPDVALDRAEHVEMSFEFETPAGVFADCVKVIETSPLEPGSQSVKIYAPGVGMIVDNELELVQFDVPDDETDEDD